MLLAGAVLLAVLVAGKSSRAMLASARLSCLVLFCLCGRLYGSVSSSSSSSNHNNGGGAGDDGSILDKQENVIEHVMTMNNSHQSMSPAVHSNMAAAGDAASSNNTTFSEALYLQTHLGARYRSLAESLALSVVYVVILITGVSMLVNHRCVCVCVDWLLITGVVGNLATCVVIVWNAHMHTATNYYLFSLAISDTITLVLGISPSLL